MMSAPPPPPAAMIAPITEAMSLEDRLQQLQHELDMALVQGELDGTARMRLYRAEAITDRITESEPPFAWLADGYDVDARLRQLQSLADRIVACIRRDEDPSLILADASRLRASVISLRESLSVPGGEGPLPFDSLLAGAGSADDDTDAPAVRGQPGREAEAPDDAGAADRGDDGPRIVGRPVDETGE